MTSTRALFASVACAALAVSTLSACSAQPQQASMTMQSTQTNEKTLRVKAAFYPLKYLTEQVGGDLVEVDSLTPDGAEPHDLELSPSAIAELSASDAVVYLKGFQEAVDEAVEEAPPAAVIDLSDAAQLVDASDEGNHAHENDDDEDERAQSGDTHDHDDAHDHDHGNIDPHFWLDPERMAQAAIALGQALASADAPHAQTYTAKAANVAASLKALSADFVNGTTNCKSHTFVTAHAAFGYLADRTGLNQVAIAGLDPESSPSPARLQEISTIAKSQGVTTIFTEALIDPKVSQTLADELGITTAVLDPIESQVDPAKDYEAVMRDNLSALRKALSCE